MNGDIEKLTADVKELKDEIAQLKVGAKLAFNENREREGFTRHAIVELARAILVLAGLGKLSTEEHAKIKKLAGAG